MESKKSKTTYHTPNNSSTIILTLIRKLLRFETEDRQRAPGCNTALDITKQDAMAGIAVAVKQHSAECKKLLRDDRSIMKGADQQINGLNKWSMVRE